MEATKKERRLRLLHCGDITLGSPYTGLSIDKCRECYHRFSSVFDTLFETVRQEGVQLVLIAGNLCGRYLTSSDAACLIKQFSSLPDCLFVIAPGDQDPYSEDSFYASGRLPQNVKIFEDEQLTRLELDSLNADIYGWGYLGQRIPLSPIHAKSVVNKERFNLLCGCCEIGTRSVFCSLTPEDIGAFGADYAAFAHGPASAVHMAGVTHYAHSGPLEGKNFEEGGIGSVILVDITADGEGKQVKTKRIPLASHRYETLTLNVEGALDMNAVFALLQPLVEENGFGEDTSLRVILEGTLSPEVTLRPEKEDADRLHLYSLEFVDRTLPAQRAAAFMKDMTVRGELYRTLEGRLSSSSVDERSAVAQAFRTGLAALESKDITIV